MPDITMCQAKYCKEEIKNKCWRFVAPPFEFQSYSDFSDKEFCDKNKSVNKTGDCVGFWKMIEK